MDTHTHTERKQKDRCIDRHLIALTFATPILQTPPTVSSDSTITLAASKANELQLKEGDVVALIGRRRRAVLARTRIVKKQPSQIVHVSANWASHLRLRQDDAVKVVPLQFADHTESRTGDLVLLQLSENIPRIQTVTLSPIQDSVDALPNGEDMEDDELLQRFVQPYMAAQGGGILKLGHVLTLMDEGGKKLDFVVSHVELEQQPTSGTLKPGKKDKEDATEEGEFV